MYKSQIRKNTVSVQKTFVILSTQSLNTGQVVNHPQAFATSPIAGMTDHGSHVILIDERSVSRLLIRDIN